MTFGTHPSEGLTFTEVNAKIQDPQWKLNPLRIFTADELKRLGGLKSEVQHLVKQVR